MKKISFYLLLLSFMSLQAAVYQGRTAYIGFCKDCHGNGTKMAKSYSSDQWRANLESKGAVLAAMHTKSPRLEAKIIEQQAKGLLPYSSVESIKEYFLNKSEIILKSMSRSEKKAAKKRIFKYQARHLKDFFVEFASDSGKVPACSDDATGQTKEQKEQEKRIQEAERLRRAKKAQLNKSKFAKAQSALSTSKAIEAAKKAKEKEAKRQAALKRQAETAKRKAELDKTNKAKAKAAKIAKAKAAKAAKARAAKAAKKEKSNSVTKSQLKNHKRKTGLTINEEIVDLVQGKLSESDLNKLKILLLSR
jgi:hypothetical protein